MRRYRFIRPPRALLRARLDNFALVPASVLPFKDQWQGIADALPRGDVLVIVPRSQCALKRSIESVVTYLRAKGRQVTTLPAEGFSGGVPS